MTDLIEKVAREICFNGEYEDWGADEPETLTCWQCDSPADCKDWSRHSFGHKRAAKAAIQTVLREMMDTYKAESAKMSLSDKNAVFIFLMMRAQHHNIDLGEEDG